MELSDADLLRLMFGDEAIKNAAKEIALAVESWVIKEYPELVMDDQEEDAWN
jgi:hypothetical protein